MNMRGVPTAVAKQGDSKGIRIPKTAADEANIHAGDQVQVVNPQNPCFEGHQQELSCCYRLGSAQEERNLVNAP